MEQYLPKSALIAEIDRELESISNASTNFALGRKMELANILSFLDTLEVKEIDLDFEKELYKAFGQVKDFTLGMCIARHFYELGLKAQSKDMIEALRTEYEKGRADVIAKTLEWINVFNDNNYIMQYSDSCEHPINEIIEWYKNYINKE